MKTSPKFGRTNTIIVTLVIVVIVLLVIIFMPKSVVEVPAANPVSTENQNPISVATSSRNSEGATYTVEAEMPVVSGLADIAIQKKINDHLAEKINTAISEFKDQAVDTKVDGPGLKSDLSMSLTSWAVVKNSVITVRLEIMQYFSGSAHPLTVSDTANYSLATGEDLGLIDVFDAGTKYLDKISAYSIKELKKHLAEAQNLPVDSKDLVFFEEGANSNPENFSSFLIEDAGIRFIFGQYQVAPYVAGEQEVLIPYSELSQFLRKGALADALLR